MVRYLGTYPGEGLDDTMYVSQLELLDSHAVRQLIWRFWGLFSASSIHRFIPCCRSCSFHGMGSSVPDSSRPYPLNLCVLTTHKAPHDLQPPIN